MQDRPITLNRACPLRERIRMALNHELFISDPWRRDSWHYPHKEARPESDFGSTRARTAKPAAGEAADVKLGILAR